MNINKVKINNELISRCKPDFSICRLKGFPLASFPLRHCKPNMKKPKCNIQGPGLLLRCDMRPYCDYIQHGSCLRHVCKCVCVCACTCMCVFMGMLSSIDLCLASIGFLHGYLDPLYILLQHLLWSHNWLRGFQSCTSKAL